MHACAHTHTHSYKAISILICIFKDSYQGKRRKKLLTFHFRLELESDIF